MIVPISSGHHLDVFISLEKEGLLGRLFLPLKAKGLVIFAHGSGSGRFSPRNRYVAEVLNKGGLGTLLLDLLTEKEEAIDQNTSEFRFDIPLLGERLITATQWVLSQPELGTRYKIGYFGASTGTAAALIAATYHAKRVHAIVSRGGRPDLAEESLPQVSAPTLLIVGGLDEEVIRLNQIAEKKMTGVKTKKLVIVEGATHLFEESGKLEEVATLATQWFSQYL